MAPADARGERYWRAVLDSLGHAVAITDVSGTLVYWNDAAERMYGWTAAEALGQPVRSLIVPRQHHPHAAEVRAALEAGKSWGGRFELQRRNGTIFPVLVTDTGVHDESGALLAIVGIFTDLTEQDAAERELAASNARWQALVSRSADLAMVADARANLTFVGPAATRMLGWRPEEVQGRNGLDLVHPEDRATVTEALGAVLADPDSHPVVEFRALHRDGSYVWVEETISNLLDHPDVAGLVGNLRDITDRRAVDDRLRRSEALYRAIVQTSREGILVVGPDETVMFANSQLAGFMGRPVDWIIGRKATELLPWDRDVPARLERRRQGVGERYELEYRQRDGQPRHLMVSANPLYDDQGSYLGSLSMYADITERKRAEAALTWMAMRDPLTGLANRTMLMEELHRALSDAPRRGGLVSVLFIDLDQFKSVNDSLGHGVGDELLLIAAERIKNVVRSADVVARLGGDEFVVLTRDLGADPEATRLAERLSDVFAEPVHVAGLELVITASIGVAITEPAALTRISLDGAAVSEIANELLRQADIALYQAKGHGRARWERYEPETSDRADQLRLVGELRQAPVNGELRLYYQPIVDLSTGETVAMEALLRWQHPTRGLLVPKEFIPLAEQTGLIGELDLWALNEACRSASAWHRASPDLPPLGIAVNLSARELGDRNLPSRLLAILRATELDPSSLVLEVTETAVMSEPDAALGILHALKGLGVRVAIDDFGTGYSSLIYLKRFPVDELKIDRSFVDGLGADPEDSAIVASILGLAKAVGVTAVAEGVETAEQARILAELGCELGQGYLWSPPTSEAALDQPDAPSTTLRSFSAGAPGRHWSRFSK